MGDRDKKISTNRVIISFDLLLVIGIKTKPLLIRIKDRSRTCILSTR